MLFYVVAITCLLAVHATPLHRYGIGSGLYDEDIDDVIGVGIGGVGSGHLGREIERSGSEFGRRGSEGSSRGYGSRGYEREGGSHSHDRGHLDRDYKQVVESHVSEGHDVGHSEGHSSRGGEREGHSRYGADEDEFGGRHYTGSRIL